MTGPFKPEQFSLSIGVSDTMSVDLSQLAAQQANAIYAKWGTCEKGGEHAPFISNIKLVGGKDVSACSNCDRKIRARWEAV